MNDIYSVAAQIAVLYPCDTIRYVAGKIADIRAQSVGGLELEMQWSPGHRKNPIVRQFCEFAAESSLASWEVASILLSACATRELVGKDGMLEILWTGPQTAAVPVRQTETALCELIDSANKDLFIVSFVAYKADKVYKAIHSALGRGVTVRILTESSKENGGSLEGDPAEILKKKFPDAKFYRWEDDSSSQHVVHAKCAIADRDAVLVTSANLTGAAMSKNMELGLLVKDRNVAGKLQRHFKALIDEHTIRRV